MVIVLVAVVILFTVNTGGKMLLPQNVNNLIAQNAYVFILATGMLFCILTGGNIDLSVGSVVCFIGAVGGSMMVNNGMNSYLSKLVMVLVGILIGAWQGFWIAYVRIPPFIVIGNICSGFTIHHYLQLFKNICSVFCWKLICINQW